MPRKKLRKHSSGSTLNKIGQGIQDATLLGADMAWTAIAPFAKSNIFDEHYNSSAAQKVGGSWSDMAAMATRGVSGGLAKSVTGEDPNTMEYRTEAGRQQGGVYASDFGEGSVGGAVSGAATGSLYGVGIGAALGGFQGISEGEADRAAQYDQNVAANAWSQQGQPMKYGGRLKKLRRGGNIGGDPQHGVYADYNVGQSHEGPDEGIEVDAMGQPVAMSGGEGVGLTEKGEITFNGNVYSDTTKLPGNKKRTFADEAKRISRKYKFYLGEKLDKQDEASRLGLQRELQTLFDIQEAKKGKMMHENDVEQLLMEQQQAQAEMVQEEQMMEEQMAQEQMMQDPAMQEQMAMEQQMGGGMPMMRRGGKLPKYGGGGMYGGRTSRPPEEYNPLFDPANFASGEKSYQFNVNEHTTPWSTTPISTEDSKGASAAGWEAASPDYGTAGMKSLGRAVGAGAGLLYNRRNQPQTLNLSRVSPHLTDEREIRTGIREDMRTSGSAAARSLSRSGMSAGARAASTGALATGMSRAQSGALTESKVREAHTNQQESARAQGINAQIDMQEKMFNAQRQAMHDEEKKSLVAELSRIPYDYFSDVESQRQYLAGLNMQHPDRALAQEEGTPWWKRKNYMSRAYGPDGSIV